MASVADFARSRDVAVGHGELCGEDFIFFRAKFIVPALY